MKKLWSNKETETLKKLKADGLYSDYEIAQKMGRTFDSVNSKLTKLKRAGLLLPPEVPESQFKVWDDPLRFEGDALILTDVEAPFQHTELINRALDLSDAWGIKNLVLGGDQLHNESLSAWGAVWTDEEEKPTLAGEMKEAKKVFKAFEMFADKWVILGNHDDRYVRALERAVKPRELLTQMGIGEQDESWKIAPYYHMGIDTSKGLYRITHPRGAGKNQAEVLAVQYHCHVIMGHSHRFLKGRDPSGDYWAIQAGHCVDETRLNYVMARDAKRDAHMPACILIRDGFPFDLCLDTPWDIMKRM